MTTRQIGLAAAIAVTSMLAGCSEGASSATNGSPSSPATASASASSAAPSAPSPSPSIDPFAPNIGDRALEIGQPRKGRGVITTVLDVKYPYPPAQYRTPDKGKVWFGIRARTCVKGNQSEGAEVYWGEWAAVDKNFGTYPGSNTSWDDFPVPQYPAYGVVNPGECVQGWLLVDMPRGKKLKKVVYRPGGQTVAEWML